MIDEALRAVLIDRLHADSIPHHHGSLYAHLAGTYRLLKEWGNPRHVCLAGLFHSIYGTAHFRRRTMPFSQRGMVRALIGEEAERLAYIFGVVDRPSETIAQWNRSDIILNDRYLRDLIVLNRQELLWLLEIEAANLIEQGGGSYCEPLGMIPLSAAALAALHGKAGGVRSTGMRTAIGGPAS